MPTPEIATDRLRLRGWHESDRAPFAAMNADSAVMEHVPGVLDRAASDALLDRIRAHWEVEAFGLWAIEQLADRRLLGFAGLSRPAFEAAFTPAIEVGWRLARDAWGHGYATEAASAAVQFAFEVVGLQEIVSFTASGNQRSRRVMERLGMTRDPADDFDHPGLPEGHPLRRHVLYRLGRADWKSRRAG